MTTTILLQVEESMLDIVKRLERPIFSGKLGKTLNIKIEHWGIVPLAAYELCDVYPSPHPLPKLDGKLVVDVKPHGEYDPWAQATGNETFTVTLEDGTEETIILDDERLDDPDEVLLIWDIRFDEFEDK
ncbi:MAG: hypothetical protein GWN58_27825 [Anaerolineae bacterium]|nr:hypothetical protein [Anaerolineae bacterium]